MLGSERHFTYVSWMSMRGTPHVFQGSLANTPESKIAMNNFLKQYLHH